VLFIPLGPLELLTSLRTLQMSLSFSKLLDEEKTQRKQVLLSRSLLKNTLEILFSKTFLCILCIKIKIGIK
jgi:hypothetical protein